METSALSRALNTLNTIERSSATRKSLIDSRACLIVTVVYLVVVLSFKLNNLGGIILLAIYPIIGSALADVAYSRLLILSLYTLPVIIFIGMFNPIFNHIPLFYIDGVPISEGWVQFASILVRGLLSVQATLLLVFICGFTGICRGLHRLGVPSLFATQLLMLYRYLFVLIEEALEMDRARRSRGYGKRNYRIKFWTTFVGQLLLRTADRAERIHQAMVSRGFSGTLSYNGNERKWGWNDTIFTVVWIVIFAFLRFFDIPEIFNQLANRVS